MVKMPMQMRAEEKIADAGNKGGEKKRITREKRKRKRKKEKEKRTNSREHRVHQTILYNVEMKM